MGSEDGYVLRRDRFDRELARRAVNAGSDLLVMCEALGFARGDGAAIVPCRRVGERFDVRAKVVIGAGEFEAQVGRWAGLDTSLSSRDFDSCIQYKMTGIDADPRYCDFHLGKRIAPGGYVWCFPRGEGVFNVGLGINGSMMSGTASPKRYLDAFMSGRPGLKDGKVLEIDAGGVSVGLPLERTVSDNIVLVGDAARMIDPLTGGGIYNACFSAIQAAKVVSSALEKGSFTEADLLPYERAWREALEPGLVRNYLAKEMFLDAPDDLLDSLLSSLSRIDMKELSTAEILRALSSEHPEIASRLSDLGNS